MKRSLACFEAESNIIGIIRNGSGKSGQGRTGHVRDGQTAWIIYWQGDGRQAKKRCGTSFMTEMKFLLWENGIFCIVVFARFLKSIPVFR